jgi:hypothetical protein
MNGPTTPLSPDMVKFEDKVKAILAFEVILAFAGLAALWTFIPPKLPGDTAGIIIGGFIALIGGIGQFYWQAKK